MSWRIVKQPNGLYARFSDIVDHFTHYNMSEKEVYKVCRFYLGAVDSETEVRHANSESGRFDDCIDIIKEVHGKLEARNAMRVGLSIKEGNL